MTENYKGSSIFFLFQMLTNVKTILNCVVMAYVVTLLARLNVCVVMDTSWPKEQLRVLVSHYCPIRAN